jgi:hypothetical protein
LSRALVIACLGACAPHPTAAPDDETEATDDDPEDPNDQLPVVAAGSDGNGAALVVEAERELSAMRTSHYEHHTHVDEATGLYDYDCSGFVGYALSHVAPAALHAIATTTRRPRPLAKHFEAAFVAAPAPWHSIARVDEIQPGDIIAWLEPPDLASRNTGHVMIVARAPRAGTRTNELVIGVIDSSHSWHGHGDTRHADRRNGLGRGDIVIVVDDAGRAIAYRWSNSKHSVVHPTSIAIGRLP